MMKKLTISFAMLVFFISIMILSPFSFQRLICRRRRQSFSTYKVHTINIRFSQPNYWDSLIYYYNQGLEQYMSATVIANGITFNNVGVRLKETLLSLIQITKKLSASDSTSMSVVRSGTA
ncbi:MAG: hypothetical protein IPL67_17875 [Ignavibacteria bacterium]|nr:hypothetical protein [Ignavibacteria bacterium]